MKKLFTLLLCLVLLFAFASCAPKAGTDSHMVDSSSAPESAAPQQPTKLHALQNSPMGTSQCAVEDGIYAVKRHVDNNWFLTYMPFDTRKTAYLCDKPDCAHTDETCGAFLLKNNPDNMDTYISDVKIAANSKHLFIMLQPNAAAGSIMMLALDGKNKTELCKLPDTAAYTPNPTYLYGDDADNLYWICNLTSAGETTWNRLNIVTGEQTVTPITLPISNVESVFCFDTTADGKAVLLVNEKMSATAQSSNETASAFITIDASGQTIATVHQYLEMDYDSRTVANGVLYAIRKGTNAVEYIHFSIGKTEVLAASLPSLPAEAVIYTMYGVWDGKLLVETQINGDTYESTTTQLFAVDVVTGDTKEITLKHNHYGGAYPVIPQFESATQFLVEMDERPFTETIIGSDGKPSSSKSAQQIFAMIDKQDYFNSVQNYEECEDLP